MKTFLRASLLLALCVAGAAQAQDGHHHDSHGGGHHDGGHHGGGPGGQPHHFAGDYHHFGPGDRALWAGGGWRHEYHDGRWGWWWFVDGLWYWYDQPVYPYPLVVSPVIYAPPVAVVYDAPPPVVYAPPPEPVVVQAPPEPEPAVPAAAPPRFRYFCPDHGYYPQVQTCPTDFVRQPIP